jgi:hypothetical protein
LPLIAPPAQYVVTGISVNATNLFTDGYTTYPGPPPTPPVYVLGIALVDTGAEDAVRIYDVEMNSQFENSRFFSISNETELNIPLQGLDAEAVQ